MYAEVKHTFTFSSITVLIEREEEVFECSEAVTIAAGGITLSASLKKTPHTYTLRSVPFKSTDLEYHWKYKD